MEPQHISVVRSEDRTQIQPQVRRSSTLMPICEFLDLMDQPTDLHTNEDFYLCQCPFLLPRDAAIGSAGAAGDAGDAEAAGTAPPEWQPGRTPEAPLAALTVDYVIHLSYFTSCPISL